MIGILQRSCINNTEGFNQCDLSKFIGNDIVGIVSRLIIVTPINFFEHLNQVLQWALGCVKILLHRYYTICYCYGGSLQVRIAYVSVTTYPVTIISLSSCYITSSIPSFFIMSMVQSAIIAMWMGELIR